MADTSGRPVTDAALRKAAAARDWEFIKNAAGIGRAVRMASAAGDWEFIKDRTGADFLAAAADAEAEQSRPRRTLPRR